MVNATKLTNAHLNSDFSNDAKAKILIDTVCLKEGDTWYLIASAWFEKWEAYVRHGSDGVCVSVPGPIDNESILNKEKDELLDGLQEKVDYVFVPADAWEILKQVYSLKSNQVPVSRKVIRISSSCEHKGILIIEVYPLVLYVHLFSDPDTLRQLVFSQATTYFELEEEITKMYRLNGPWRLYVKLEGQKYSLLNQHDKNTRLHELSLVPGQQLVVDVPVNDKWHVSDGSPSKAKTGGGGGGSGGFGAPSSSMIVESSTSKALMPTPASGLCGLTNLGNTCFLNSAVQCLSNVPPLTEYFLSGRFKEEVNATNPLGMRGELAVAYAEVIHNLWKGTASSYVPTKFKFTVGRFQPMFSGFQQQDSQELMAFLLDGLHEDLNRIKDKPYMEAEELENEPDEVLAERAWSYYKLRNDSIITDLFTGLLKSTVVCPDCHKVSITFDPFGLLSLPLPEKPEKMLSVMFVPYEYTSKISQHQIGVNRSQTISDAVKSLSTMINVSAKRIVCLDATTPQLQLMNEGDTFQRFVSFRERQQPKLIAYEVDKAPVFGEDLVTVCVYNNRLRDGRWECDRDFLALPHVLRISKSADFASEVMKTARTVMKRYVDAKYYSKYDASWENIKNGSIHGDSDEGFNDEDNSGGGNMGAFTLAPCTPCGMAFSGELVAPENSTVVYVAAKWNPDFENYLLRDATVFETSGEESSRRQLRCARIIELADCLDLFTMTEKLGEQDAWYCPRCKKHQQATKKFDLWSLPEVLVIHLKRFSSIRNFRSKIDTVVDFPVKNLNMSKWVINKKSAGYAYNLVSVSNHDGGLGGGHYTAFGLNYLKNQWYSFNDYSVCRITENDIVSKAAYVLVYLRQNTKVQITEETESTDDMETED